MFEEIDSLSLESIADSILFVKELCCVAHMIYY